MSGRRKWIFHIVIMQNRAFFLLEPREACGPLSTVSIGASWLVNIYCRLQDSGHFPRVVTRGED